MKFSIKIFDLALGSRSSIVCAEEKTLAGIAAQVHQHFFA